jgi:hypothetical protein
MKNLRDGMEDYEYLAILERLAGRKSVRKIVDTVAADWWNFSRDAGKFLAARERLAGQILSLKKADER